MRLRPSVRRRVRRQAAVSGGVIGGDKAKTVTAGTPSNQEDSNMVVT